MKIVIVAVAGLVLGIGAGGAVGALQVKGRVLEEHAKAAADSAAAASHTIELPPEEGVDTTALPLGDVDLAEHTGAPDSALASNEAGGSPSAGDVPQPQSAPTNGVSRTEGAVPLDVDGARKLAKIFGAMKPADAAAVLAEMSDVEVRAVLMQMSDREAAPILGAFPAARAAALSREVLQIRAGG